MHFWGSRSRYHLTSLGLWVAALEVFASIVVHILSASPQLSLWQ